MAMWLPNGGQTFSFIIMAIVLAISVGRCPAEQQQFDQSKVNVVKRVFELLDNLEQTNELNSSTKLAALLSEFLIKQRVRFIQPTRYEAQFYYHFMHRLKALLSKNVNYDGNALQQQILDNIFQRQVRLTPTVLKYGQIDANLEYESLANQYEKLEDNGFPNSTTSDLCLAALATLNGCELNDVCLHIIVSTEPTYGYHRMHQVFLLYVLMHHKCSTVFGTTLTYEYLAKAHCTAAYREQNVIRSLGMPAKYHDLFVEQIVICGLFGFNEFVNWHNVVELTTWPSERGCLCLEQTNNTNDCQCTNHLNNLALVYYINALLLLN